MLARRAMQSMVAAAMAAISCTRGDAPAKVESARATTPAVPTTAPGASVWDAELGALLIVPSDSENAAVVLYPSADSGGNVSEPVTLVDVGGDTARATISRTDSLACAEAPVVRVDGVANGTWSVGTAKRSAALIRMDSIEALPSADSSRMAADIARLASALPMQKGSHFGGLPFAVVSARRFVMNRRQYLVAQLTRRLNQEAQPLEERTFVIAERPDSSKNELYAVTYSQRSEGSEDTAEHFDVLAGFRGHQSPLLVVARDQLSRTKYEVLARQSDGSWRVRWSRTLGC